MAEAIHQQFGIVPGTPKERDGKDGSGLTVDYTFDDADPPFAVEITRLRKDFESWDNDDERRFKARIERHVRTRGWSSGWSIGLAPETSFKSGLAPAVVRMIEWMVAASLSRLGPGSWSADVPIEMFQRLQRVKGRDFTKECHQARLKGVIQIQRIPEDGVEVIVIQESSDHKALQRPIARALDEKAARSLGQAKERGYVTFLAADVEREDTQERLAAGMRLWDFPPQIDHLYLLVRKKPNGDLAAMYYANKTRDGRQMVRMQSREQRRAQYSPKFIPH